MTQAHNNTPNTIKSNELPKDPNNAIHHLCRLSQNLLDLAERESQALVQRDMIAFSFLQDEKEDLSHRYLGVSQEFRDRLNEFRRVDAHTINKLDTIQNTLGERTNDNNKLIEQMGLNAEQKVMDGMLIAQEYGSSDRAEFPANYSESEG